MKKFLVFVMGAIFAVTAIACDSDDEESLTQDEVASEMCTKMADCSNPLFTDMETCVPTVNTAYLDSCNPFNGSAAVDCVDDAKAMDCAEFNAATTSMSFPESCDLMCP